MWNITGTRRGTSDRERLPHPDRKTGRGGLRTSRSQFDTERCVVYRHEPSSCGRESRNIIPHFAPGDKRRTLRGATRISEVARQQSENARLLGVSRAARSRRVHIRIADDDTRQRR
jgi:hypothetical protein